MTETSALPSSTLRRGLLLGGAATMGLAAGATLYLRRDRFAGDEMQPPEALAALRAGEILLVDIRRPEEWAATGIAEGALPLDMRRDDFVAAVTALAGGDRKRPVALICAAGVRSDRTAERLAAAGFTDIIDVPEGMEGSAAGPGWIARGLPVVRP